MSDNELVSTELRIIRRLMKNGFNVKDVLDESGFSSVAIYGYGLQGKEFEKFLVDDGVKISYIFDKDVSKKSYTCRLIHSFDEVNDDPDLFVVTPHLCFKEIREELKKYYPEDRIVSLAELAEELLLVMELN